MSQTSNIISPCSRLNADVLRQIFIHCLNYHGDPCPPEHIISTGFVVYQGDWKPSIRNYPQLGVSKVCSSWRDIALLTPKLWDDISIPDLTKASLSIAREYLSRVKDLPVSIKINITRPWTGEPPWQDRCSQLTDFLSSYRIRTLDLTASVVTPHFHLVLLGLPQRSVAQLESLSIFAHLDQEEAQINLNEIDLNDARYPKLAVVHIKGAYKISSFNSMSRSLRIFDGTRFPMTVIESWDLLSCCPSLEESQLKITQLGGSRRPVSMPQIHLQCLCILKLDSGSQILFSTFIEVLTFPVVEKLHVLNGWSATAFQSLAHRSNYFSHLKDFDLTTTMTRAVDVGALLALMPQLTSIYLHGFSTIFDRLALNGLASGSLAPRLQSLRTGYNLDMGPFLDMVESRWKNAQMSSNGVPARFTKVGFLASYLEDSDRQRLRDMQWWGIPIRDARS